MDANQRTVRVLELSPNGYWDARHFKLKTGKVAVYS